MIRFSPKKGLVFIELNTRWELQRTLINGKLQFESESGELKNLTSKELLKLHHSGKWLVDINTISLNAGSVYLATPRDLDTYPNKTQKIVQRKTHYLLKVNPDKNKYNEQRWKALIQKAAIDINDEAPPAPSTVHSWWKRYRITKSITALLPRSQEKIVDERDSRFEIFIEVVKTLYLNPQKLPVIEVVRKVQQRIVLLNAHREEKLKTVGRSTVYRWMALLRKDIADTSRLGADVARTKYRSVMGGLKISQILERVEIDHTPLDVEVINTDTNLPMGRAWLTLAIDKHSRMVLGFYISYNAPSSYSVLQCIKQMILAKDKLLERFPDIKNDWPVYGIPDLIALDNGMDLHSEALKKACLEMGIQILYCPAATPQMKGSIERFFRTIAKDLIHKLPGTTFSNISERGDYDSEKYAAIDMETLTYLILKWIVDVYHASYHRGIKDTPLNKWHESAVHRIFELPVYPTQLDVITGIPAKRTVFHYGIELEGLHYNSKELQEIRKISGENMQVQLKFYEDQVHYIDVYNPYAEEYLRVECVQPQYTQNLHRATHRLIRALARKTHGEQVSVPQLLEARNQIEKTIQEAVSSKKMRERKLAAGLMMNDSNAVFESKNKGPIARPTAPEPLESGLDDELPIVNGLLKGLNDEAT